MSIRAIPHSSGGVNGKDSPMQETQVQSLGWEDPPEKEMQSHSRILDRKTLWTEEPGRLHTVHHTAMRHDWAHTQHSIFLLLYL